MTNGKVPKTIRELYFHIGTLVAGISAKIEKFESTQKELTEHKLNHWRIIKIVVSTMIGITAINVTLFIFIIKYFSSGS